MPVAITEAMQLHLKEISRHVAEAARAVLLLDRAGWHATDKLDAPGNIAPIFPPSRAAKLNPVENIWRHMLANWLSNRVSTPYEEIIEAACEAWRKLIAEPDRITSIGMRRWDHVVRPNDSWYESQHGRAASEVGLRARLRLWN